MINWKVSKADALTIIRIVDRAGAMAKKMGHEINRHEMDMDLAACHANGCLLDLPALLDADDGDFVHDVFGIRRFIDRETGELGGCFFPRFALSQHESEERYTRRVQAQASL